MTGMTYVIRIYSILAILSLGVFGFLNIYDSPEKIVGYLELIGSAIFLLNLVIFKLTGRINLVKNVFLLNVLAFLGVMLVTGGTGGTGLLWVFVFPVTTFFLSGKRAGMIWMGALLTMIAFLWLLSAAQLITIPYDGIILRQLIISLLVVTIGIYAYQFTREQLTTENQANRLELQTEKIRSDIIVQNITEGIVMTDIHGKVTFVNQAAQTMLGWSAEELVGKDFISEVALVDETGHNVAAEDRPLYSSLHVGKPLTINAQYRRKDKSTIAVSATGIPLIVNNELTGAIGTFHDITEEQEMTRAKSEFVTLASHQLRTPLSALSWVSELLLNGDAGRLSAEQREHVEAISKSAQRMSALVSEMLLVSSLDLHALPVVPQKVNLANLATRLIKEQASLHANRHIAVREDYDAKLPSYRCDPELMKIVLQNILSNAFKYTAKQGTVTVHIGVSSTIKLHPTSKGSIELTISDTGYGIPKEANSRIFSKFFRAKNIVHRDTDGTGLGLYIVKALLDYIGGQVSFQSQEDQGTVFTVILPLEGMVAYQPSQTIAANVAEEGEKHA